MKIKDAKNVLAGWSASLVRDEAKAWLERAGRAIEPKILQAMTAECPDELRPRLLSVLGNSQRSAGWISFNADDLSATRRYYEQARVVAHDAQDLELATMVLANLSHAAESSGKPAIAVDYAVAAQAWAERAHNACLSALLPILAHVPLRR